MEQRIFLYIISVCIAVSRFYKVQVESFLLIYFFQVFSVVGGVLVIRYWLFTVLCFNTKTLCSWGFTSCLKDILIRKELLRWILQIPNSFSSCLFAKAINKNYILSKWWSGKEEYFNGSCFTSKACQIQYIFIKEFSYKFFLIAW